MGTVIDWIGGPVVIVALAVIVIVLSVILLRTRIGKGKRTSPRSTTPDEEKVAMGLRIVEQEKANTELRERLRNLEMEYLQRQENIKNSEIELQRKAKELEEGLKEVYAYKELIEDYRLKVAKLDKEKAGLEIKLGEVSSKLKEGTKKFERERDEEIKKLEEEKEAVKKEAKEMVLTYKKETEDRIKSLEDENKDIKDRLAKLKDQYSAWEAIEGL